MREPRGGGDYLSRSVPVLRSAELGSGEVFCKLHRSQWI